MCSTYLLQVLHCAKQCTITQIKQYKSHKSNFQNTCIFKKWSELTIGLASLFDGYIGVEVDSLWCLEKVLSADCKIIKIFAPSPLGRIFHKNIC